MSRTYRRRGQRHEYRWVLRDSRWIDRVLVTVFIDARSKFGRMKSTRDWLTISHRQRVIEELRSPDVAAEYLKAAAEDGDPRVYAIALKTVAAATS